MSNEKIHNTRNKTKATDEKEDNNNAAIVGVQGARDKLKTNIFDLTGETLELQENTNNHESDSWRRSSYQDNRHEPKSDERYSSDGPERQEANRWERRLDQILTTIEERISRLETNKDNVRNDRKANEDYDKEEQEERETSPSSTDRNIEELISKLREKRSEEIVLKTISEEQLEITEEELKAAAQTAHQRPRLGLNILNLDRITDPLAKVIEKRRLYLIKNWSTIWSQIQLLSDKPGLADKTWKKIAFGQYVDISDCLKRETEQVIKEDESPFRLTDNGLIKIERERKVKINNLPLWVQAWERYSEAVLILYETRQNELAHHQSKVIKLCTEFPFDIVSHWDIAKRIALTESRNQTLITTDTELDTHHLIYARSRKLTEHNTRPRKETIRSNAAEICKKFNWSRGCEFGRTCLYRHECAICAGNHPAKSCDTREPFYKRRRIGEDQRETGKQKREATEKRS
jgi:hypothetical protein